MSRLDYAIGRLKTCRVCIDHAIAEVGGLPGPILELGLGNGRTFDHLREALPGRDIFVFELEIAAHPDCIPDEGHLFEGDIRDSLPGALARLGGRAVMAHCDIGSGDAALNAALAAFVGPALAPLLAPGAVVAADQALAIPGCQRTPLPDGVNPGRYHLYRLRDT